MDRILDKLTYKRSLPDRASFTLIEGFLDTHCLLLVIDMWALSLQCFWSVEERYVRFPLHQIVL